MESCRVLSALSVLFYEVHVDLHDVVDDTMLLKMDFSE